MDKKTILNKLLSKKGKDYTYTIAFFVIFSFFTFFVIRPNILAVFQANLKIENLKKTNTLYETQIQNVINAQTVLVEARDDLDLLDQAITAKPQVNELIQDINNVVDKDNLTISKMNLVDVNLKDVSRTKELKPVVVNISTNGVFDEYLSSIKDIYNQRRIKILKDINLSKSTEFSSDSGQLKMSFQIEGYYL